MAAAATPSISTIRAATTAKAWSAASPTGHQAPAVSRSTATPTLLDAVNFSSIEHLFAVGTYKDDTVNGGANADTIHGLAGHDTLRGGLGEDWVYGGDGDDTVVHGNQANLFLFTTTNSGEDANAIHLYGGGGIDTLWISLVSETEDITVTGSATPDVEFSGSNITGFTDGSQVSGFEILRDVRTGDGKDSVTQVGDFDNVIDTGWDVDVIKPGMGTDNVNGGYDFELGVEVEYQTVTVPSGPEGLESETITAPIAIDFTKVLANPGDLLELDYSAYAGSGGITGAVSRVASTIGLRLSNPTHSPTSVMTNNGSYTGRFERSARVLRRSSGSRLPVATATTHWSARTIPLQAASALSARSRPFAATTSSTAERATTSLSAIPARTRCTAATATMSSRASRTPSSAPRTRRKPSWTSSTAMAVRTCSCSAPERRCSIGNS